MILREQFNNRKKQKTESVEDFAGDLIKMGNTLDLDNRSDLDNRYLVDL